ncbi:MAG: nuclease A inhibitor family protein [Spirosomataceae bacterium]
MNEEEIKSKLTALLADVWFPSESDEPFEIDIKEGLVGSEMEKLECISPGFTEGRLLDWSLFWQPLITPADWHGTDEEVTRLKFCELKRFFEENTIDFFVAKTGKIEVNVWIIGTLPNAMNIVLKTLSIES